MHIPGPLPTCTFLESPCSEGVLGYCVWVKSSFTLFLLSVIKGYVKKILELALKEEKMDFMLTYYKRSFQMKSMIYEVESVGS